MTTPHTPSTEDLRRIYVLARVAEEEAPQDKAKYHAEFDRWLTVHNSQESSTELHGLLKKATGYLTPANIWTQAVNTIDIGVRLSELHSYAAQTTPEPAPAIVDVEEVAQHSKNSNAEDCPRCTQSSLDKLPYPFICPGDDRYIVD